MNILQVTLGFPPAVHWGGPVKTVHQTAKELIRRGHRVTVACTNLLDKHNKIRPYTFEDEIDGIQVIYFKAFNLPQWPGTLGPIWLRDLQRLKDELPEYDVVHLNGYRNLMNLQIVLLLKNLPVPLVIQPRGTMQVIVNSLLVKRLYDRLLGSRLLRRAQAFIALQETEKRQIMAYGVPAKRIEIIPNGLDMDSVPREIPFGRFREQFGIPQNSKMILFLGRINRKKGTDMLVRAFARLEDRSAYLAIAGSDDGQLAEAQALVQQYGISERVVFTGLLSGNITWAAYRDADLFALPCRTDTFPTTILEACAMDTPMVITEGCEMAHLVQDKVATVTPFDAAAFAQAMQDLLDDRGHYQRYQANCKALMQSTFSVRATVDRLEMLYQRVKGEAI